MYSVVLDRGQGDVGQEHAAAVVVEHEQQEAAVADPLAGVDRRDAEPRVLIRERQVPRKPPADGKAPVPRPRLAEAHAHRGRRVDQPLGQCRVDRVDIDVVVEPADRQRPGPGGVEAGPAEGDPADDAHLVAGHLGLAVLKRLVRVRLDPVALGPGHDRQRAAHLPRDGGCHRQAGQRQQAEKRQAGASAHGAAWYRMQQRAGSSPSRSYSDSRAGSSPSRLDEAQRAGSSPSRSYSDSRAGSSPSRLDEAQRAGSSPSRSYSDSRAGSSPSRLDEAD